MIDTPIAEYVRRSTLETIAADARGRLVPKLKRRGEFMPWEVHSEERDGVRVAIMAVVTLVKPGPMDGKSA